LTDKQNCVKPHIVHFYPLLTFFVTHEESFGASPGKRVGFLFVFFV